MWANCVDWPWGLQTRASLLQACVVHPSAGERGRVQQFDHRVPQAIDVDRLGDVALKAGGERALAVIGAR